MERPRPVNYSVYHEDETDESRFEVKWRKEERKGFYHGIVRGTNKADPHSRLSVSYDYGLVEDSETGKLVKVEFTDITFTDRMSLKAMEEFFNSQQS